MIKCNLCQWETADDNVHGKERHEVWHRDARKQKRNTTQGIVNWEVI